jgi:hypothetical protein
MRALLKAQQADDDLQEDFLDPEWYEAPSHQDLVKAQLHFYPRSILISRDEILRLCKLHGDHRVDWNARVGRFTPEGCVCYAIPSRQDPGPILGVRFGEGGGDYYSISN